MPAITPQGEAPRTWSATFRFPDGAEWALDPPSRDLHNYEGDLLASCVKVALRQAAEILEPGEDPETCRIVVYKTTKARGTEFDRSFCLAWRNGRLTAYRI